MFASRAFLAAGLLVACSGASSPEIPAASNDTSQTEPPVGTPASPGASGAQPGIASGEVTPDDPEDPGKPDELGREDPPKPDDPPTSKPECIVEAEGNNTWMTATRFTSCVVGKVTGANNPDFLRVVAPAKARKMHIEHKEEGKIRYTVFREKGTWPLNSVAEFTNDAPDVSVNPGEAYLFRLAFPLAANGNSDRAYELKVSFK